MLNSNQTGAETGLDLEGPSMAMQQTTLVKRLVAVLAAVTVGVSACVPGPQSTTDDVDVEYAQERSSDGGLDWNIAVTPEFWTQMMGPEGNVLAPEAYNRVSRTLYNHISQFIDKTMLAMHAGCPARWDLIDIERVTGPHQGFHGKVMLVRGSCSPPPRRVT
jgi:hypothetical protein